MNYMSHFHRDPNLVNGQWVIKGTRVTLRTILATLAEGVSEESILADFAEHDVEEWRGGFVVVSGRKVRVRRA